jgi:tagaturonate reductase
MQQLNKEIFIQQTASGKALLALPERVLQFGNGVLLRGLPDFYIDAANKQGVFMGRIVVVKTTPGNIDDFENQDFIYTHRIKGLQNGKAIDETHLNASISRVLSAGSQWEQILDCAANPDIDIVFSNTTEQGFVYQEEKIGTEAPASFPGKLLAYLLHRFQKIGSQESSRICIIPTELVEHNGQKLRTFLKDLSKFNELPAEFEAWFEKNVLVCNSLVDRIVPGKPAPEILAQYQSELQYTDHYLIESEPFNLWAIEGSPAVLCDWLSFSQCADGIKITEDISIFKELKLRLLNAAHSFSAGVALNRQLETVSEAMADPNFQDFIVALMEDIQVAIPIEIAETVKRKFAADVLDRFRNPSIRHLWTSIIVNYTEKFKIRCVPLLLQFYRINGRFSPWMIRGLAGYFMYASSFDKSKQELGLAGTIRNEVEAYFSSDVPSAALEHLTESVLEVIETEFKSKKGHEQAS